MPPNKPSVVETRSTLLRRLLVLAVAFLIGLACTKAWQDLQIHLQKSQTELQIRFLLYAFFLALAYRLINSLGWSFILKSLNIPLRLSQGIGIWLSSEAMRWLPGSVWSWGSRAWQAHQKLQISKTRASLTVTLELLLTLAAWLLSAIIAFQGSQVKSEVLAFLNPGILLLLGGLGFSGFLFLAALLRFHPQGIVQRKILGILHDLKEVHHSQPRYWGLALTLVFYTLLCCVNGVGLAFLIQAFVATPIDLQTLICINSVAWIAGFLAIGAPGGVGIREAGITGMLSLVIPASAAFLSALAWRLVQVAAEVSCLLPLLPKILTRK